MTAWSALFITGELLLRSAENIRVLVIGASGGVGTVAVQMLRFRGAQVYNLHFSYCNSSHHLSEDHFPLVSQRVSATLMIQFLHCSFLCIFHIFLIEQSFFVDSMKHY